MALACIATREGLPNGIFQHFFGCVCVCGNGRFWNSFRSPIPLWRTSPGLHLSHFQPPATVMGLQFLDAEGFVASGCGVWWLALQDIVFLAFAGGNVFHVFPCVYRTEGTECSLWQKGWFDRAQPPVPGPSNRSNLEMEPQAQYDLRGGQHPCSLQQGGVSNSNVVQPSWRLRSP